MASIPKDVGSALSTDGGSEELRFQQSTALALDLLSSGENSDFGLMYGNKTFKVHRIYVLHRCDFLKQVSIAQSLVLFHGN
jgi:hypothetical protein